MVTWIAEKSACLHEYMPCEGGDVLRRVADHAAAAATIMPKENEADITVLVSKTERAERARRPKAGRPWSL